MLEDDVAVCCVSAAEATALRSLGGCAEDEVRRAHVRGARGGDSDGDNEEERARTWLRVEERVDCPGEAALNARVRAAGEALQLLRDALRHPLGGRREASDSGGGRVAADDIEGAAVWAPVLWHAIGAAAAEHATGRATAAAEAAVRAAAAILEQSAASTEAGRDAPAGAELAPTPLEFAQALPAERGGPPTAFWAAVVDSVVSECLATLDPSSSPASRGVWRELRWPRDAGLQRDASLGVLVSDATRRWCWWLRWVAQSGRDAADAAAQRLLARLDGFFEVGADAELPVGLALAAFGQFVAIGNAAYALELTSACAAAAEAAATCLGRAAAASAEELECCVAACTAATGSATTSSAAHFRRRLHALHRQWLEATPARATVDAFLCRAVDQSFARFAVAAGLQHEGQRWCDARCAAVLREMCAFVRQAADSPAAVAASLPGCTSLEQCLANMGAM